jgi:hypothetical protein
MNLVPDDLEVILYSPTQKCLHIQRLNEMFKDGRKLLEGELLADFYPVLLALGPGDAETKCEMIHCTHPEAFKRAHKATR